MKTKGYPSTSGQVEVVDGVIRYVFSQMKSIPKSEVVNSSFAAVQKEQESRYKAAERDYTKASADLAELKGEVLKSIRGESKFAPELLSELIAEAEKQLANAETARDNLKQDLESCKSRVEKMQAKYDEVISWSELYDAAEHSAKKMIIANLVNRIEVERGYKVHIDFSIDLEHFKVNLVEYEESKTA